MPGLEIPHPTVEDGRQTVNLAKLARWAQETVDTLDGLETWLTLLGSFVEDELGVYRTLQTVAGFATGLGSINTTAKLVRPDGTAHTTTAAFPWVGLYLDPADYEIPGKEAQLRTRVQMFTNATAPGINVAIGLYPITAVAGGAGVITRTLGTRVTDSHVTFNAPGASSMFNATSPVYDLPSAGHYGIGSIGNAAQAANSFIAFEAQLQLHYV